MIDCAFFLLLVCRTGRISSSICAPDLFFLAPITYGHFGQFRGLSVRDPTSLALRVCCLAVCRFSGSQLPAPMLLSLQAFTSLFARRSGPLCAVLRSSDSHPWLDFFCFDGWREASGWEESESFPFFSTPGPPVAPHP